MIIIDDNKNYNVFSNSEFVFEDILKNLEKIELNIKSRLKSLLSYIDNYSIERTKFSTTTKLTDYEYIHINNNLNIDSKYIQKIVNSGHIDKHKNRIFQSDLFDIEYNILYYKRSDDIYSVFIGKNFELNDETIVKFMYDYSEMVLLKNLEQLGVSFNKMKDANDIIVFPKSNISIVDVKFIFEFYKTIFKCIQYFLPDRSFDFEYLYEVAERPGILNFDQSLYVRIWNFARCYPNSAEEDDDEYLDILNNIYKTLMK